MSFLSLYKTAFLIVVAGEGGWVTRRFNLSLEGVLWCAEKRERIRTRSGRKGVPSFFATPS